MITYTLIGWYASNFKSDNGNEIRGYNMIFTRPISSNGQGSIASRYWYSEYNFELLKPVVGMKCDLRFSPTRQGKLTEVIKL